MKITLIDVIFVVLPLTIMGMAFYRRRTVPAPEPGPPASLLEVFLTVLTCIPAAIGPNVLVVALTPGMPGMAILVKWALIPSIILLGIVWIAAARLGLPRLTNRIWTGLWVGFAASAALDAFRLTSFSLGMLSANLPRMFGQLILGTMAQGPTPVSDIVGGFYHFWISASFGLAYALLAGRTRWWGGLIWGLIIEIGMMTTPPMVMFMHTGYFGLNLGKGLLNKVFIGSLVPHIFYGIALGLLLERYTRHKGSILKIAQEVFSPSGAGSTVSHEASGTGPRRGA